MKRSSMVEGYGIPLDRVLALASRHDSPLLAATVLLLPAAIRPARLPRAALPPHVRNAGGRPAVPARMTDSVADGLDWTGCISHSVTKAMPT
jgi:hypothetical protein